MPRLRVGVAQRADRVLPSGRRSEGRRSGRRVRRRLRRHSITISNRYGDIAAVWPISSKSTSSLRIERIVANRLASDGMVFSGSRWVMITCASGYAANSAGKRGEVPRALQQPPTGRLPLQELQQPPVEAVALRAVVHRQPALVVRDVLRRAPDRRRELHEHADVALVGRRPAGLVHGEELRRDEPPQPHVGAGLRPRGSVVRVAASGGGQGYCSSQVSGARNRGSSAMSSNVIVVPERAMPAMNTGSWITSSSISGCCRVRLLDLAAGPSTIGAARCASALGRAA